MHAWTAPPRAPALACGESNAGWLVCSDTARAPPPHKNTAASAGAAAAGYFRLLALAAAGRLLLRRLLALAPSLVSLVKLALDLCVRVRRGMMMRV